MKRSISAALIASLLSLTVSAFADTGDVGVSIRYYDKQVYYAGNGPILVHVTVTNNGSSTYRFKLADERAFSVDFDVRSLSNRPLPANDRIIKKRTEDQRVFFREVSVESGESFSFTENLRDYANLDDPGSYVVQAKLFPELYRADGSSPSMDSNRLALDLRPQPLVDEASPPPALDVDSNAVLVRAPLPPDQVIDYLLTARQKGQWEKFFLYLDLESMLTRDGVRKRAWSAASEQERQRMLDRYRADLRKAVVDNDIATIPIEFSVERTSYAADEGTVTALEKFRFGTYVERKRYTYYLRRRDDIWMVVDYSVMNLGAE